MTTRSPEQSAPVRPAPRPTERALSPDFTALKAAVAAQFHRMRQHPLYRTAAEGEALWRTYLASFPEGTNPVYRERTEHDCSACRSFVKAVGNCVAIVDGEVVSLWDVQVPSEPAYQAVCDALSALVKSHPVRDVLLHPEPKAGVDRNFEEVVGGAKAWQHLFVNLPASAVKKGADIPAALAGPRATHDVFLRGLTEITPDSLAAVLDLIGQNSIYRGEEHRWAVAEFENLKRQFDALGSDTARDLFAWSRSRGLTESVARMRNTSIGTLLTDLSGGKDLEEAVRSFEAMVAPQNYKRPTALVTKAMVQKAQQKIEELGLMSALSRRHATLADITVNNVLHANRSARPAMAGNVFEEITASLPDAAKNYDRVEEVGAEEFITRVLPRAESVEVLLENRHAPNLVSLIAPEDPTAGSLFKWGNNFSWDYAGGFADSIRERVKRAGGSVEGDLCCRLGWFNTDDLDLHMSEPGGSHIYYGHKQSPHTGGQLDVDMNVTRLVRDAVENIYYGRRAAMREGVYTLAVNQFTRRESADVGFEVEIDYLGAVTRFAYEKPVKPGETVTVAKFRYTHAGGVEFVESLPSSEVAKSLWGLPTQSFHKVSVLMYSPNHWDGERVGNRHYFLMLDGAVREGAARGFYNEFLKNELDPHRKAFEMVGSRMRSEGTADQLSGLGFSSTQRNHIIVRVKGAVTRTLKVTF